MIKGAIFDLDGTLIQTLPSLIWTGNAMLEHYGLAPRSDSDFRHFVGYGAYELVRRLLKSHGIDDEAKTRAAYAVYLELFEEGCIKNIAVYPGINEVLDELDRQGLPYSVLTNKPHQMTHKVIAHCFDPNRFRILQGQSDAWPRKPDPTAALHLAEQMGVEPAACAFVGDSDADMQTAVNGGMIGIGAVWGFRDAAELKQNGATHLCATPREFAELLAAQR